MKKNTLSVLMTAGVLLFAAFFASLNMAESADAAKSQGTTTKAFGAKTSSKVCGDQLCGASREQPVTKPQTPLPERPMACTKEYMPVCGSDGKTYGNACTAKAAGVPVAYKGECKAEGKYTSSMAHKSKTVTNTITSTQDPGIGHESHQLAVILPPSDQIYKGTVTYSASEPVQLVALTGPLAEGQDKGQPIWTPDGKTKFALTLVEAPASGTWTFAGNALALHTKNTKPFTASYAVSYAEKKATETITTGTITSTQDPGIGHESHQLAVILPPSDKPYSGMLTYSASEPVQLVALTGPLAEGQDKGQPIWTPDGKTKFALTLVEAPASGTWTFAGNALALHTKNTDPFTVSYTVVASQ